MIIFTGIVIAIAFSIFNYCKARKFDKLQQARHKELMDRLEGMIAFQERINLAEPQENGAYKRIHEAPLRS